MGAGGRDRQHRLQALSHVASLLGPARTAKLDHVQAEAALAAVRSLARLALFTPFHKMNAYLAAKIKEVGLYGVNELLISEVTEDRSEWNAYEAEDNVLQGQFT